MEQRRPQGYCPRPEGGLLRTPSAWLASPVPQAYLRRRAEDEATSAGGGGGAGPACRLCALAGRPLQALSVLPCPRPPTSCAAPREAEVRSARPGERQVGTAAGKARARLWLRGPAGGDGWARPRHLAAPPASPSPPGRPRPRDLRPGRLAPPESGPESAARGPPSPPSCPAHRRGHRPGAWGSARRLPSRPPEPAPRLPAGLTVQPPPPGSPLGSPPALLGI